MAVTTKHREPRHTKKLPVLCSGSNPEVVATKYKKPFQRWMNDQKSQMAENPRFVLKKKLRCGWIVPGKKVAQIQTTVGFAGNLGRIRGTGI